LPRLLGCGPCRDPGTSAKPSRRSAELPAQIAAYRRELDATPPENKAQREMRKWQIRRDKKRLAEVEARLAAMKAEP
jgi:hypothetical protein